ncbi:MAG: hypothetical protein IPM69_06185 [Ignavibacteria bacterium]|nr:hypothetical protein [Ignavibacteria bacterium]
MNEISSNINTSYDVRFVSGNQSGRFSEAALAPADPSGQDLAVAAQAAAAALQARTENSHLKADSPQGYSPRENSTKTRANNIVKLYSSPAPVGSLYSAREMCTLCRTTTSCGHLSA